MTKDKSGRFIAAFLHKNSIRPASGSATNDEGVGDGSAPHNTAARRAVL